MAIRAKKNNSRLTLSAYVGYNSEEGIEEWLPLATRPTILELESIAKTLEECDEFRIVDSIGNPVKHYDTRADLLAS